MKLDERAFARLQDWAAHPQSGDVLDDRFELERRIGEGGMGIVYAAHDRAEGRAVAVKILRGGGERDEARFEREIHALTAVSHPALVRYVAHGLHEGARYVVMARLEGIDLAERLRLGRLSVRDTVTIGKRACAGLAELHRAGVAHRDVKPSNVFLVGDLHGSDVRDACLVDLGLARGAGSTTLTAPGALLGTPGYMAPERVRGDRTDDDGAGDVFSLGCVLYECLLGRPLFESDATDAQLARVLLELPPLVGALRPDVPRPLDDLLARMLAKEPSRRPSAREAEQMLSALLSAHEEVLPPADRTSTPGGAREIAPGVHEGDLIDERYVVEGRLGEGGMGVVVAARHRELGTHVAIKLLRSESADEGRFLREAKAASRLESEHVVRVLDVGRTAGGRPFIVMEHLKGDDLAKRLRASGPLPAATAASLLLQTCAALTEAHALGIVHRDLKPSNLFLARRRDGREVLKVLDFGISKLTQPLDDGARATTTTGASVVMGSLPYMAPEQLTSASTADARSDVWSLGVVLFELVTGAHPFEGDSALAVASRIAASPPRRLLELVPDAPAGLEAVIERCLMKSPDARYADVASLARALEAVSDPTAAPPSAREPSAPDAHAHAPDAHAHAPAPTTNDVPAPATRGWLVAGVLALVAGIVAVLALTPRSGPPTTVGETTTATSSRPVSAPALPTSPSSFPSRPEEPSAASTARSAEEPHAPTTTSAAAAPTAATTSTTSTTRRAVPPPTARVGAPTSSSDGAPTSRPTPANQPAVDLLDPALQSR